MLRTRDFILLALVVAFLVIAVLYTAFDRNATERSVFVPSDTSAELTTVTGEVAVLSDNNLSRADRLEKMRLKVQASELVRISAPEDTVLVDNIESVLPTEALSSEVVLCPGYLSGYSPYWPIGEISSQTTEGVRQYYVSSEVPVGTSSAVTIEKEILLALVQNVGSLGLQNCLSHDVVGIALDGSLIRNDEATLYSVFDNTSLIGYALDGYPIYGRGQNQADECGGRIELGQYRYELNDSRGLVLHCFSGSPQSFSQ